MRPQSACLACRQRRRKCIKARQGTSCELCIERNIPCIAAQEETAIPRENGYETIAPRRRHPLTHNLNMLPDTELSAELIDLYFRHIHASFHLLFHKPSFLVAFRNSSLPKILLFGVIGLSARFSQHESLARIPPRERGSPYIKEAERFFNIHDASLVTIQACMLLGAASVIEGEGATESIYFSIACRMAMLLDLPNVPAKTRIEQEINNRVWWTLYGTDTWSSFAVRLPKMLTWRNVPLPMDEKEFLAITPATDFDPSQRPGSSILPHVPPFDSLIAQSTVLNQIFTQVGEFLMQVVSGEIEGGELILAVEAISQKLENWASSLSERVRDTPDNLAYWTEQGYGHLFVRLHIDYYHFNQLLFYPFLHDNADPKNCHLSPTYLYARKCRHHATDLCDVIHRAINTPGAEPLYSVAGHILTIASTVQLHILLFGNNETETENAKRSLEQNFQILTLLKSYWPCLDVSFSRFETFHNACLQRQDGSHFQMDQWMLKFILAFAEPVDAMRNWEVR